MTSPNGAPGDDLVTTGDDFCTNFPTRAASGHPRVAITTLGCKVNQTESEEMERRLRDAGYDMVNFGAEADVYLINTCTVTQAADRKSRQFIRRAKGLNPSAKVAVTGCMAEIASGQVSQMPEVDVLLGRKQQHMVERELAASLSFPGAIRQSSCTKCSRNHQRTRAFVKVQDGCDSYCTYCIVPYARGGPSSVQADHIVAEIGRLADNGYQEVVLTGIHMGKYRSGGAALCDLIRHLLEETDIPRLRLSSIEPADFPEEILGFCEGGRLARHVHLPLQSGCDATLERMGRHYTGSQYYGLVERIRGRVPDVAITTDFMVGFPGETAEEFSESLGLAGSIGFAKMHVFPYSIRPGTPAAGMPGQVPEQVKKERAEAARKLSDEGAKEFASRFVGRGLEVLWEERSGGEAGAIWTGLTDNYIRVQAQTERNLNNTVTRTSIISSGEGGVWGHPL